MKKYLIRFFVLIAILGGAFYYSSTEASLATQVNPALQDQHYSRPQLIRSTRYQNNVYYRTGWRRWDSSVRNWWTLNRRASMYKRGGWFNN